MFTLVTGLATSAWAQTRLVSRGDVSATLGWLAADAGSPGPFSGSQWESSLYGAAGTGWYWTDHLKTEADFGAGTTGEAYFAVPVTINGLPGHRVTERTFSRRALSLSQQYQFFRNAWFHPHVAAGANLTWERRTDYLQPVFVFDPATRITREVEPARTEGARTAFAIRPFAGGGFKAYMTRQAFFRSDLRVGFRNGIDETILRFGFGVDF